GNSDLQTQLQPYSGWLAGVRRNRTDTRFLSAVRISRDGNLRGRYVTQARAAAARDRLAHSLVGSVPLHEVHSRLHLGLDETVLGQAAVAGRVHDSLRDAIRERV